MRAKIVRAVRSISAAIIGISLLGAASPAAAATLLDTIGGPPSSYAATQSWGVYWDSNNNGQTIAVPFSLAAPATITDITAYIWGYSDPHITLGIMGDNFGYASGVFINSQSGILLPSPSLATSPVTLSSLAWSLPAGSYWLAALADPGTSCCSGWVQNQLLYGLMGGSSNPPFGPNAWYSFNEQKAMALITGFETVVPLPATFPLFATGLGVLAFLARRKKWKAAGRTGR